MFMSPGWSLHGCLMTMDGFTSRRSNRFINLASILLTLFAAAFAFGMRTVSFNMQKNALIEFYKDSAREQSGYIKKSILKIILSSSSGGEVIDKFISPIFSRSDSPVRVIHSESITSQYGAEDNETAITELEKGALADGKAREWENDGYYVCLEVLKAQKNCQTCHHMPGAPDQPVPIGYPLGLLEIKISKKLQIAAISRMDKEQKYGELIIIFFIAVFGLIVNRLAVKLAKSELAASEAEKRSHVFAQAIKDAIVVLDGDGVVRFWNPAAETLTGFRIDEVAGKPLGPFIIPPEYLKKYNNAVPKFKNTGKGNIVGKTVELYCLRKNGERFPIELSVSSFRHENSWHAVGIIKDITDRKQAEEELRERTNMLKKSQEVARLGTYSLDIGSGIWSCSEILDEIFGITGLSFDKNVDGWLSLIHPDQKEEMQNYLANDVMAKRQPFNKEYRIIRANDGQVRWVHGMGELVEDSIGSLVSMFGIIQDITERKQAEEDRMNLEKQVQQAQKLESLGVLAGGIAHDFNNILTGILGNAELALDEVGDGSVAMEHIRDIETAGKRAADLVRQILAYSGKGKFINKSIDVNKVIMEMDHLLGVSISKNATLKYNCQENIPFIKGDVTQIRQIVMNLIINASEAIGDNRGVITVDTGVMWCESNYLIESYLREPLPAGLYTYFDVTDTGSGMDSDTLGKLFDPFFTTKFTGRGLGMAAVLGILRSHHGAIKIYSESGKGTTFKVLFPAVDTAKEADVKIVEEHGESWSMEGVALLVDDERLVREVGGKMLEKLGLTVMYASDGEEAVSIYSEHKDKITFVLLDLTMPRMDGEECFRRIREIDSDAKIIMTSGYNKHNVSRRFTDGGMTGFVHKPFQISAIRKTLMTTFKNRNG